MFTRTFAPIAAALSTRARHAVVDPATLAPDARAAFVDALFACHERIFAGVDRAQFAAYVVDSPAAWTRIFVLRDPDGVPHYPGGEERLLSEQERARRVAAGDAFAMTIAGKTFSERKLAGRALMKEIMTLVHLREEDEKTIARIGGFDLVFSGQRFGNDEFQYDVALARTGAETDIDLALTVTPLGAVSRIEHILAGVEDERSQYRFRLDDAKRRLASYQSRQGGEFGFEDELADKRRQLDAIEADLADEVLKEGKEAMEAA